MDVFIQAYETIDNNKPLVQSWYLIQVFTQIKTAPIYPCAICIRLAICPSFSSLSHRVHLLTRTSSHPSPSKSITHCLQHSPLLLSIPVLESCCLSSSSYFLLKSQSPCTRIASYPGLPPTRGLAHVSWHSSFSVNLHVLKHVRSECLATRLVLTCMSFHPSFSKSVSQCLLQKTRKQTWAGLSLQRCNSSFKLL